MANKNLTLKTLSLGAASAAAALIFALLFKNFLNAGALTSLIFLVLGGILFLAVFVIHCLLTDKFLASASVSALSAILIMAVFFSQLSFLMLIAGIGIIGFLLVAYYGAQLELKNNLDIRFFKVASYVTKLASSGLAIFAIISYLSLLNLKDPIAARKTLSAILKPAEPITAAYIPGFKINDSLRAIASKIMPPEVKLSSESIQEEFIQQSSTRLSQVIAGYLKVPVSAGDTVLDIAYKSSVGKLLKLTPVMQSLALVGFGLLTFLFVKFLLFFVNWIAILLALGIYQILWGSGFFKIELQSRTKKVIVLEENIQ